VKHRWNSDLVGNLAIPGSAGPRNGHHGRLMSAADLAHLLTVPPTSGILLRLERVGLNLGLFSLADSFFFCSDNPLNSFTPTYQHLCASACVYFFSSCHSSTGLTRLLGMPLPLQKIP